MTPKNLTYVPILSVSVLLFTAISGCRPGAMEEVPLSTIRVAVLPDRSPDVLTARYEPLMEYLSSTTGMQFELVIPDDYEHILRLFSEGDVELAFFGGVTYAKAMIAFDAQPLVMRDVDFRFTSYFIAQSDGREGNIGHYENGTLAFGSELSTSGHLMPRYFLKEEFGDPDTFFSAISYSGAHDRTVRMVVDGVVDVGAVNAQIFHTMLSDGRVSSDEIEVIYETPPYADYVWAIQNRLSESLKMEIRDAFLGLRPDVQSHAEILKDMGAGGFLPSDAECFAELIEIFKSVELSE